MTTLTIDLPLSIQVGGPAGQERTLATGAWNAQFILEAALHGIKQRRTDRFSVVKAQKGLTEALKALRELDERLIAGEIPTSGTRGPRQDDETRGWVAYFKAAGVKEAGEPVKAATLDRAQETYCRQVILASAETPEQRKEFSGMMQALLDANKDAIIEAAEKDLDKGQPGWFIEQERKRAQKAAPIKGPSGFKLKVK